MSPYTKILARKQIIEEYGIAIKVDKECEYKILFLLYQKKIDDKYNKELK